MTFFAILTQIERLRIRNWAHYFVQVESIWRDNNWIQEQRQKFPKNIKDWKIWDIVMVFRSLKRWIKTRSILNLDSLNFPAISSFNKQKQLLYVLFTELVSKTGLLNIISWIGGKIKITKKTDMFWLIYWSKEDLVAAWDFPPFKTHKRYILKSFDLYNNHLN